MKCPACNSTYDFGNKCPHCKTDTVLYKRTIRLSERLYNQGLERLKASDFTQGIELLNKSVVIDKNNITARNLLGLALFEVGYIGDALMHWVISSSLDTRDNPAEDYLESVKKNPRALEKLNDAVVMYNNALNHIKQKSDDLAIIQLKRAVEINPRFVDALNLIALCHLIQNDKERALIAVERALSIDARNPIALKYHSLVSPKPKSVLSVTAPSKFVARTPETVGPYKAMGMNNKKSTNFHIAEIFAFIVGVGLTAAIGYFLLFPALEQRHENDIARMENTALQATETHQQEVDSILLDKQDLQTEINNRDNTINEQGQNIELLNRINQANQAVWLYYRDYLQEAIDIIDDLDIRGMPFDIRNRIEVIREGAYPRLANLYFAEGQAAFNADDFYKAIVDLEMALRFMDDTEVTTQWRDMWFMLGSMYYNNGMLEEALAMLQPLRENFPNHRPQASTRMIRSIEDRLEN